MFSFLRWLYLCELRWNAFYNSVLSGRILVLMWLLRLARVVRHFAVVLYTWDFKSWLCYTAALLIQRAWFVHVAVVIDKWLLHLWWPFNCPGPYIFEIHFLINCRLGKSLVEIEARVWRCPKSTKVRLRTHIMTDSCRSFTACSLCMRLRFPSIILNLVKILWLSDPRSSRWEAIFHFMGIFRSYHNSRHSRSQASFV